MPVRRSELRDWVEIVAIYNFAVAARDATADLKPVTVEGRSAWFEAHRDPLYPIYVDDDGSRIRGWCSVSSYRPGRDALAGTVEVSYYVHPEFRRAGVASGLLIHALLECQQCGFRNVIAIVLGVNQASVALLTKFGFVRWGCLPGIVEIDGRKIDHLYFGKKIGQD